MPRFLILAASAVVMVALSSVAITTAQAGAGAQAAVPSPAGLSLPSTQYQAIQAVLSISCRSAGDCTAGGVFRDRAGHRQAFVVSETKGAWGKAIEVPGSGRLNVAGDATVESVSCTSPGNCGAGGVYGLPLSPVAPSEQPFVVTERNGTWGKVIKVLGLGNDAVESDVASVSCTSAGNCGAGGGVEDLSSETDTPFAVSQVNGRWQKAIRLRGAVPLNGGIAGINQLSCPSAGNCGAAGIFTDHADRGQAFVATEVSGRWQRAIEVPGTAGLNAGGNAQVNSVSCGSAGNCSAGGFYTDHRNRSQAFVVREIGGHWLKAIEVPGTAALNAGGNAQVNWVSCPSAGNCAAGGSYQDRHGHQQAFVVSEVNGHWHTARPLVF
jgi:hypothetical protein